MASGEQSTEGRVEIAPGIRVLAAGEHGWAVWVDWEDEAPCYPTQEQAIRAARQRAAEEAEEANADGDETTDHAGALRLLASGAAWQCTETAQMLEDAADEIERLRAAWLRVIQAGNSCAATGQPCREAKRCGCAAEQDMLVQEARDAG